MLDQVLPQPPRSQRTVLRYKEGAELELPQRHLVLLVEGQPVRVILRAGLIDLRDDKPNGWRYRRVVEVFLPDEGYDRVARLGVGRTRQRCDEHKWVDAPEVPAHNSQGVFFQKNRRRPRRCGSCSYPDWAAHWECDPCRKADGEGCAECSRLTAAKPALKFEVFGAGCRHGLLVSLAQNLVAPFVEGTKLRVDGIDLAVDVEVPAEAMVAFQKSSQPMRGRFKTVSAFWNGFDVVPGIQLGALPNQLCIYDKRAEVRRCTAPDSEHYDPFARLPSHVEGWSFVTRSEFRYRPLQLELSGKLETLFDELSPFWNHVGVADLRYVVGSTPLSALLQHARTYGLVRNAPCEDQLKAFRHFWRGGNEADGSDRVLEAGSA